MTTDPRPRPEPDRDGLAALLAEHRQIVTRELGRCSCGWYVERGEGAAQARAAHLADVIRDHLRAVLGDEGLREYARLAVCRHLPPEDDALHRAVFEYALVDAVRAVVADRLGLGEA